MPAIKVRAANENGLEDRIRRAPEQRDRERVPHFGNWLTYTLSLGLPSVTVLKGAKHGEDNQTLTPGVEEALVKWVDT